MLDLLLLQAFLAGVLTFFAPCSVAMLPAMVAYYLGQPRKSPEPLSAIFPAKEGNRRLAATLLVTGGAWVLLGLLHAFRTRTGATSLSPLQPILILAGLGLLLAGLAKGWGHSYWWRGLRLGFSAAAGVLLVFLLAGLGFQYAFGDRLTVAQLSWGVLLVAAVLVGLGVLGLLGRMPGFSVRLAAPRKEAPGHAVLFGAAYGVVSLGCNLPVFALVLLGAFAREGFLGGVFVFLAFGAGMASLLLLAVFASLASGAAVARWLSRSVPWLNRIASIILILSGLYVAYYYLAVVRLAT